jgi:hypothetical protein
MIAQKLFHPYFREGHISLSTIPTPAEDKERLNQQLSDQCYQQQRPIKIVDWPCAFVRAASKKLPERKASRKLNRDGYRSYRNSLAPS